LRVVREIAIALGSHEEHGHGQLLHRGVAVEACGSLRGRRKRRELPLPSGAQEQAGSAKNRQIFRG
jgi:hypothetical protein